MVMIQDMNQEEKKLSQIEISANEYISDLDFSEDTPENLVREAFIDGYNKAVADAGYYLRHTLREGEDSYGCICTMTDRVTKEATLYWFKKAMTQ